MDLLDIISTIHDLSQKSSEYNEEIANLNLTVHTLATALQNMELIENKAEGSNYKFYRDVLREQLMEAQALLTKVNDRNSPSQERWGKKIIKSIKNMLPGSELSQIKDINEKIRNTTQLINFMLSTEAKRYRRQRSADFSPSAAKIETHVRRKRTKEKSTPTASKKKLLEMAAESDSDSERSPDRMMPTKKPVQKLKKQATHDQKSREKLEVPLSGEKRNRRKPPLDKVVVKQPPRIVEINTQQSQLSSSDSPSLSEAENSAMVKETLAIPTNSIMFAPTMTMPQPKEEPLPLFELTFAASINASKPIGRTRSKSKEKALKSQRSQIHDLMNLAKRNSIDQIEVLEQPLPVAPIQSNTFVEVASFELGRLQFQKFPPTVIGYISKKHFVITAKKKSMLAAVNSKPVPDNKALCEEEKELDTTDLLLRNDEDEESSRSIRLLDSQDEVENVLNEGSSGVCKPPAEYQFVLTDFSRNGTFLNEKKLKSSKEYLLTDGDEIKVVHNKESGLIIQFIFRSLIKPEVSGDNKD